MKISGAIGIRISFPGYTSANVWFFVSSFLGWPLSVIGLWAVISGKPWPKWLVAFSFPIYIWHFVLIKFMCGAIKHIDTLYPQLKLYSIIACNPFGYVIGMTMLVFASIGVARLVSKVRWLNLIFQGGRL